MLFPLSRIIALLMAGALCFLLLLPMALARHNEILAIFVVVVFVAYLIANILLWQRTRRHG